MRVASYASEIPYNWYRHSIDFTTSPDEVEELIKALEYNKRLNKNLQNQSSKEFLTRKEVAELCKVKSLSTLWYWKQKGILVPTANAGRKPLYKHSDVIDFLKNKEGGSSNV